MVNLGFDKREIAILTGVLGLSFIIRLFLFPLQGYQNDISTYSYWFNTAAENGVRTFYTVVLQEAGWIDYPPFNVYLFWGFGSLSHWLGINIVNIVKLVPNLFDLAIAVVMFFFIRKQLDFKLSLLATALYVFNPAVIYNAAVWGQFDAIYTFFLVLSLVLALKSKSELSAVSLAVAILSKPQAIALLPLIAFLIFKKNGLKRFLFSTIAFIVTVLVVIIPMEWSNPVTFLSDIYFGAYSGYEFMSVNAFNFWGIFGLWVPDGGFYILGWALFGAFTVFSLFVVNKRWGKSNEMFLIFIAFAFLFAFFMLPTRIHERYLFPAISLLALMFPFINKARQFYLVITVTFFANISYVLYSLNSGFFVYSDNLVAIVVSVVNLIMFLYTSLLMWDELKGTSRFKIESLRIGKKEEKKKVNLS